MTGRHRNTTRPGSGLRIVATTVVVIVALAGAAYAYRSFASDDTGATCADPVKLSVAVSPDLAPAVKAATATWIRGGVDIGGRCLAVDIAAVESADVAGALVARTGTAVAGLAANSQVKAPDVWMPDSSLWLQRLGSSGQQIVPSTGQSIAQSPVVLAMPAPTATNLGYPGTPVAWTDIVKRMTSGTGLRAGIVDPARDAAGLSGLVAFGVAAQTVGGAASGQQLAAATLRGLVTGRSSVRDDLFQRFPKGPEASALASGLAAAPLSEQAVLAYNTKSPAVPLTPVYAEPASPALDYPFVAMLGIDPLRANGADKLRIMLGEPGFKDRLAGVGLRAPDGSTGKNFPSTSGAPQGGGQGAAAPQLAVIEKLLASWNAMTAPARTLTLIDVSGSMLRPVPTANNASRMAVTIDASKRGLQLFDDSWVNGLWIFSTELDGTKDYKELVPIGPVASNRGQLVAALDGMKPKENGDTGMYDSILAAYQALQNGWTEGMVNTLILLTDGENDDKNGLNREQLLGELGKVKDQKRPIRVLIITIGPDVSPTNLKPITDLTGGGVFAAPDPAKISDIFLQAITTRT
jgi:Ca-activated chloride channel family protein